MRRACVRLGVALAALAAFVAAGDASARPERTAFETLYEIGDAVTGG